MKDIALEQLVDIMPANLNNNSESDEEDSDSSSWIIVFLMIPTLAIYRLTLI